MTNINQAKVLRVGLIYNGRILDEQIIRKPETIYIGDSPKSHFVVPSNELPSKFPIFYFESGKYELVVLKNMSGKIFLKGKVIDIEEAISKDLMKKKGKAFVLPLSSDARGKIAIGSAIILFQFITPPPKPPKLKLPKSIKGSWLQFIDWTFLGIQFSMYVLSLLFFSWLYTLPEPAPVSLDQMSNRFAKLIVPDIEKIKEKAEKEKIDDKALGEGKTVKKEEKKEEPDKKEITKGEEDSNNKDKKPRDAVTRAKEDAMRVEQIKSKVAGMGLLKIIGTTGEGSAGGAIVSDVLGEGGKDKDIDTALSGVKQIGVATSAGQRSRKGDGTAVTTQKVADLEVQKGGKVEVKGGIQEKAIVAKASIGAPEVDGTIDKDGVDKVVKMNYNAIKRCYEKELKANPDLKGKISVIFMINAEGRVQTVDITTDTVGNENVSSCIKSVVKRWRFPKPDEGSVSIEYPFIFSSGG